MTESAPAVGCPGSPTSVPKGSNRVTRSITVFNSFPTGGSDHEVVIVFTVKNGAGAGCLARAGVDPL